MPTISALSLYNLNEIYLSLQGEGNWAGTPMVIVRLQGCAVGCVFCDTKQTWQLDRHMQVDTIEEANAIKSRFCTVSAEVIAEYCAQKFPRRWALITGGEPAQQQLSALVSALHEKGYYVALETSGTALGHLTAGFDWITVSPKIDNPAQLPLLDMACSIANEVKFVVGKDADIAKARTFLESVPLAPDTRISLQPMSMSKRATALCIAACLQNDWCLSVQLHKFVEID